MYCKIEDIAFNLYSRPIHTYVPIDMYFVLIIELNYPPPRKEF